jgi:hypothetical protein
MGGKSGTSSPSQEEPARARPGHQRSDNVIFNVPDCVPKAIARRETFLQCVTFCGIAVVDHGLTEISRRGEDMNFTIQARTVGAGETLDGKAYSRDRMLPIVTDGGARCGLGGGT